MTALTTLLCGCKLDPDNCSELERKEAHFLTELSERFPGEEENLLNVQKQIDGMVTNCWDGADYNPCVGVHARAKFLVESLFRETLKNNTAHMNATMYEELMQKEVEVWQEAVGEKD